MSMGHKEGYPKTSDTPLCIFTLQKVEACATQTKKDILEIFKHQFNHSVFIFIF